MSNSVEPMTNNLASPVPNGVRAIAALFALCAIYLCIAGGLILLRPGTIAMSAGAPLLFGLELAGPYMLLLMAVAAGGAPGVPWKSNTFAATTGCPTATQG